LAALRTHRTECVLAVVIAQIQCSGADGSLRPGWALRRKSAQVLISGANAERVISGCINVATGTSLPLARGQRGEDFLKTLRLELPGDVWYNLTYS